MYSLIIPNDILVAFIVIHLSAKHSLFARLCLCSPFSTSHR